MLKINYLSKNWTNLKYNFKFVQINSKFLNYNKFCLPFYCNIVVIKRTSTEIEKVSLIGKKIEGNTFPNSFFNLSILLLPLENQIHFPMLQLDSLLLLQIDNRFFERL